MLAGAPRSFSLPFHPSICVRVPCQNLVVLNDFGEYPCQLYSTFSDGQKVFLNLFYRPITIYPDVWRPCKHNSALSSTATLVKGLRSKFVAFTPLSSLLPVHSAFLQDKSAESESDDEFEAVSFLHVLVLLAADLDTMAYELGWSIICSSCFDADVLMT